VHGDDESQVAAELFGSDTTVGARMLAEHAGGGVVVVREVQRMSPRLQDQTATAIANDLGAGYGARVRWILTAEATGIEDSASSGLAPAILDVTKHHMIRVPALEERREDLPLLIVRLLDVVAAEQGKEIAGIDLSTLDSLLTHGFNGQMSELLGELRRLVSATRSGDTIRGSVRGETAFGAAGEAGLDESDAEAVQMLHEDDLKVVIPAVERMLIDRVLRRARGNQSKAARELNLSRGALISKIKEYDIPDYRALRRRDG
jgi:DNA-binding NtrC family response regulator